eukprot:TRINITY_DN5691_c0_g1_i1.p1 TRINITY_DN5691_c0_g1~~TRINITY_DN5691_c0_g1_i1.p1  ORF type:complete len:572 (+),score=127.13 TRINITY_DN5691_c0_g1_i1:116-1831(+)
MLRACFRTFLATKPFPCFPSGPGLLVRMSTLAKNLPGDGNKEKLEQSSDLAELKKKLEAGAKTYAETVSHLQEYARFIHPRVPYLAIPDMTVILETFSKYRLPAEGLYRDMETAFIQKSRKLTDEDDITVIIESLLRVNSLSERFLLELETKILRGINNWSLQNLVRVVNALAKVNRGSKRFYRSLGSYFKHKFEELTPDQVIQISRSLLRTDRSRTEDVILLLKKSEERINASLKKLPPGTIVSLMVFSTFELPTVKDRFALEHKAAEKEVKLQELLYSSVPATSRPQAVATLPEIPFESGKLLSTVQSFLFLSPERLSTLRLPELGDLIAVYLKHQQPIPQDLSSHISRHFNENYLKLTPQEFQVTFELLGRKLLAAPEFKPLLDSLLSYIRHFKAELDTSEAIQLWMLADELHLENRFLIFVELTQPIHSQIDDLQLEDLIKVLHLIVKSCALYRNAKDRSPVAPQMLVLIQKDLLGALLKQLTSITLQQFEALLKVLMNLPLPMNYELLTRLIRLAAESRLRSFEEYARLRSILDSLTAERSLDIKVVAEATKVAISGLKAKYEGAR